MPHICPHDAAAHLLEQRIATRVACVSTCVSDGRIVVDWCMHFVSIRARWRYGARTVRLRRAVASVVLRATRLAIL